MASNQVRHERVFLGAREAALVAAERFGVGVLPAVRLERLHVGVTLAANVALVRLLS